MAHRSRFAHYPLFGSESVWNQDVTHVPQHQDGAAIEWQVGKTLICKRLNFLNVNCKENSIPIYEAEVGTDSRVIMRIQPAGDIWFSPMFPACDGAHPPCSVVGVPKARTALREALGYDQHLALVTGGDEPESYDFWHAEPCDRQVRATGTVARFKLRGPGAQSHDADVSKTSARGTGVALLGGLILPEDFVSLEAPVIRHALAVAVPELRWLEKGCSYVYPASKPEEHPKDTHAYQIAAGQRIRLRPQIHGVDGGRICEDHLPPVAAALLAALRTYGAYAVDQAGAFAVYAEDPHTAPFDATEEQLGILTCGVAAGCEEGPPWYRLMCSLGELIHSDLGGLPFAYREQVTGAWKSNFVVLADAVEPAGGAENETPPA